MSVNTDTVQALLLYSLFFLFTWIDGICRIIGSVKNDIEYQLHHKYHHHENEENKNILFHEVKLVLFTNQLQKENKQDHITKHYR